MKISIVLPAYNEEKALSKVVNEIVNKCVPVLESKKLDWEILIVDDGSTDNTFSIARTLAAKNNRIAVVKHSKNLGKVSAIRTGIKNAKGDIIVLMDADYTYPAEHITQMVEKVEEGYELVLGSRFLKTSPAVKHRFGNLLLSALISYFGGKDVKDGQTGLRAFKKEDFINLDVPAKGLEFETKQTIKAAKLGFRIAEIPINYRARLGKSKLKPFRDGYRMLRAIGAVTISESSVVAKLMLFPSAIMFILGLIFGLISVIEKIQYGVLQHAYFPLISVLFIILAVQVFSMGLILDSIARRLERIERRLRF